MPLSAFPKTFGLTKLKKVYFPHLFNTPDYQDYIGDMPPKKDYMPKGMSVKGAGEFDKWYDQQVVDGVMFDFTKELIEYLTIILRNRAEYRLILSRRGRRPSWLKSGDIPQD